jgi:Putative Flp pilus-assembly TadE/G-like
MYMSRRATTHSIDSAGEARWRRSGRGRRRLRGQTLIIFALSFTVLLGLAGLTIDVARAYDLYARMQRAAEAGALAGVLYMPANYDSPRSTDLESAVSRASEEVVMDGFGMALSATDTTACGNLPVSICPITGRSDDLQVTVTQTLDLVLLSGVGVQPVTLTASASAEYLPPAQIGARLNYFGDQVECYNDPNNPDITNTSACPIPSSGELQTFLGVFNGPDELKEQGDPFVYCEEGPAYASPDGSNGNIPVYNGDRTNHPQHPGGLGSILNYCGQPSPTEPGNPDQQPAGFSGQMTTGTNYPSGFNFLLNVPTGIVGGAALWVYNPSFIPSNNGNHNPQNIFDHFNNSGCTYFIGPFGTGIQNFCASGLYDAPPFYYNITYSLYNVSSVFDRSTDTPANYSTTTPTTNFTTYPPYDAEPGDLSAHGCSGSTQVYDPYWEGGATPNSYNIGIDGSNGCFALTTGSAGTASPYEQNAPAPCWQAWCPIFVSLPAGTYRLAIEGTGLTSSGGIGTTTYTSGLTSGYGPHMYALKLCPESSLAGPNPTPISCSDDATSNPPGLQLAAWNNMDVYFQSGLSLNQPNAADPSTTCVPSGAIIGTAYTCLDLACIPTSYAGRTLSVQIYDPGDGSNNSDIFVGVAEAGGGTTDVTYPGLTSVMLDGDSVVQARFGQSQGNYNAFNGVWLTAEVTLPSDYTGDCTGGPNSTGWWQMIYASSNGTPTDVVGMKLSLTGSPVHLLTLLA